MGASPPKAPDPVKTAGAQTAQNVGTGIVNQVMGQTNQVTPNGSLTYNQTGTYKYTDPNSGQVYDIPQYTSTQTLSPEQQALQNEQTRAGTNTARLAADQSQRLGGILGKPIDLKGAPKVGLPQLGQVGAGPQLATSYGDAGGYEKGRKSVEDALMARLNPSLNQDRSRLETQLTNQGLTRGSEAWNSAVDEFGRQSNDARYGAVLNAGQEQSRLAGLDQSKALFGNDALQQMYSNQLGATGFNNNAAQQTFANQQGMRNQYLNEQYTSRNQPINEIAALLGTGQVQQPSFMNTPGGQVANTDFAGIQQQGYQNQLGAYNARQQMLGGLFSGMGQAASSAVMMSDARLKHSLVPLGSFGGLPVYEFSYIGEDRRHVGFLAQDVRKVRPEAVITTPSGYLAVDYGMLL